MADNKNKTAESNPYESPVIDEETKPTAFYRSAIFAFIITVVSVLRAGYLYLMPVSVPPDSYTLNVSTAIRRSGVVQIALCFLAGGLASAAWLMLRSRSRLMQSLGQMLLGAGVATYVLSFLVI